VKVITLISLSLTAAAFSAATAAAQKPNLPPGIYFVWTPPGPRTVTADHPNLPNNDWVRDQSHANVRADQAPGAAGAAQSAAGNGRGVPDLTWFRISTAAEDAAPPDLHRGGTDVVAAGRSAEVWFGNQDVTRSDSVFVSARIFRQEGPHRSPVKEVTAREPLPAGSWGSKTALSLGTLPSGRYLIRIRAVDRARGLDARLERRVVAR
jgi:hypothetical protein